MCCFGSDGDTSCWSLPSPSSLDAVLRLLGQGEPEDEEPELDEGKDDLGVRLGRYVDRGPLGGSCALIESVSAWRASDP